MEKKRSKGITILASIIIISGVISISLSLLTIYRYPRFIPSFLYVISWGTLIIASGIGLLKLKKWARILTLILVAIKMPQICIGSFTDVQRMFTNPVAIGTIMAAIGITLVSLMPGIIVLYYFTRPKVKEQFNNVKAAPS